MRAAEDQWLYRVRQAGQSDADYHIRIRMLKAWTSRSVEEQCVPDECPDMGQLGTDGTVGDSPAKTPCRPLRPYQRTHFHSLCEEER